MGQRTNLLLQVEGRSGALTIFSGTILFNQNLTITYDVHHSEPYCADTLQ